MARNFLRVLAASMLLTASAAAQFGGNTAFGWYSAGPFGFPARVTSLVADPRSTGTILFGSPGGGIWRSLDTGVNWAPLTDSAPTLQVCSLALDPVNPDNLYAGTGDPRSLRPNLGVMRSTDSGKTWSLASFAAQPVCAVAVDPAHHTNVLAASLDGIFLSTDSGARFQQVSSMPVQEIAFDPAANGIVYATVNSPNFFFSSQAPSLLVKSVDGGATWNPVALPTNVSGSIFLHASAAVGSGGTIYLAIQYKNVSSVFVDAYTSADGGGTWIVNTRVANGSTTGSGRVPLFFDSDNKFLYLGTTSVGRSLPAAQSFPALKTSGSGPINGLLVLASAAPPVAVAAGDTGIDIVPLDGTAATALPLPALGLMLDVNSDPLNVSVTYAGGDDGLFYLPATGSWRKVSTTAAGQAQATATNPQNIYASANGVFLRSANGGTTFTTVTAMPTTELRAPYPPMLVNPLSPNIVYTAGQRIFRSVDSGATWAAFSAAIDSAAQNVVVALTAAPTASQVMYAATACLPDVAGATCSTGTKIFVSANSGSTWTLLTTVSGVVNRLVPDPRLPTTFYAAIGSFPAGPSKVAGQASAGGVLRITLVGGTTGVTVSSISANLPDTGINSLTIDAQSGAATTGATSYYIGTDLGVFATFNGGASWIAINTGLPSVPVSDINLRRPDGALRAATYGRGVFVASIAHIPTAPVMQPMDASVGVMQGQNTAYRFSLSNGTAASFDFTVTSNATWLVPDLAGGTLGPNSSAGVNLTVKGAGLALGNYTAKITVVRIGVPGVSSNFSQDFTLRLKVTAAAASLKVVSGDGVTANAGAVVPLIVQTLDSAGNPLSGITVSFRISSGSGTISAASAVSDIQGNATASLTLPNASGVVKVLASSAGLQVTFTVTSNRPVVPALSSGAAVNAASFRAGGDLGVGSIAAVFGTDLATGLGGATGLPLPSSIGGTRVLIGGVAAPLFSVGPGQINLQVPFDTPPGRTQLAVEYPGPVLSNSIDVNIAAAAPGIFLLPTGGGTAGLFIKPTDGSVVTSQNPAKRGSLIILYATGLGAVDNPVAAGAAAKSSPLSRTLTVPAINIGGTDATVQFSGLAPGYVGLYQINLVVPPGISPEQNAAVTLRIGGVTSNTVTIPVN